MSLLGAMFSAVSGLQSDSSAMSAISDNVVNTNTVGYKATDVQFKTLVTRQASATMYSAGGVQAKPYQYVNDQGLLSSTGHNSDFAISGGGMFVVSDHPESGVNGNFGYTRAGSFTPDQRGYYKNTAGLYLQGWSLLNSDGSPSASEVDVGGQKFMRAYMDKNGQIVYINSSVINGLNLRPFNTSDIGGTSVPTSEANLRNYNLPSNTATGDKHYAAPEVIDTLGAKHTIQTFLFKSGNNQWGLEQIPPTGAASLSVSSSNDKIYSSVGRVDLATLPETGSYIDLTVGGQKIRVNFGDTSGGKDEIHTNPPTIPGNPPPAGARIEFTVDSVKTKDKTEIMKNVAKKLNAIFSYGADTLAPITLGTALQKADFTPNLTGTISTNTNITLSKPLTVGGKKYGTGTVLAVPAGTVMSATGSIPTGTKMLSEVASNAPITANERVVLLAHGLGWGVPGKNGVLPQPQEWVSAENAVSYGSLMIRNETNQDIGVDLEHLVAKGGNVVQGIKGGSLSATLQGRDLDKVSVPPQHITDFVIHRLDDKFTMGGKHALVNGGSGSFRNSIPAIQFSPSGLPSKFFGFDRSSLPDARAHVSINWTNGSEDMSAAGSVPPITFGLGSYNAKTGFTQMGAAYSKGTYFQNGSPYGNMLGFNIGKDGIITATFSNGVTKPVFQIPLATFINPNEMSSISGNAWQETDRSGHPTIREANSSRAGAIEGGSLESSNSDLGTEFSKMITIQRAYSSNTKIVTTVDNMLQELVAMKR